jgi:hypothetical protein
MAALLSLPKVWELLTGFKEWCRRKGWKTCEESDWIRIDHEYHDFVWARNVQPSTFVKVSQNPKCIVRDGYSYRIVNASYVAWLFQQPPSESLLQTLIGASDLHERTALYDLSQVYQGNPACLKLNTTRSLVFREFESFIAEKWAVTVKPAYKD